MGISQVEAHFRSGYASLSSLWGETIVPIEVIVPLTRLALANKLAFIQEHEDECTGPPIQEPANMHAQATKCIGPNLITHVKPPFSGTCKMTLSCSTLASYLPYSIWHAK